MLLTFNAICALNVAICCYLNIGTLLLCVHKSVLYVGDLRLSYG